MTEVQALQVRGGVAIVVRGGVRNAGCGGGNEGGPVWVY